MRRPGSVLLFAALSLAIHLAWVVWMPEPARPTPAETHWVELSYDEASAQLAAVAEAPALEELAAIEQVQKPTSARAPKAVEPARVEFTHSSVAPAPTKPAELQPKAAAPAPTTQPNRPPLAAAAPATPTVLPVPPQPVAPHSEAAMAPAAPSGSLKKADLLPRAAALSLDAFPNSSALRCGERASANATDCAPTQTETGQAAQSALTRDLNGVASHVPHLKPREHPVLKRRSDGSYTYENGVFQALVRPDGKVEFRDTAIRSELHLSWVPFTVIADLNDVVERDVLGRELYSAEKQWLLEETRELREKLASDARRRELLDANRALERTLRGILDDRSLSVAQKHEALFLLWQDCGEDAQAQAHRRAVDSFVQRYIPEKSALGFRSEELDRFNSTRPGLQRFDPYSGS